MTIFKLPLNILSLRRRRYLKFYKAVVSHKIFVFPPLPRSTGPQSSVWPSRVGFICLKWLSSVQASISELVIWTALTISGELSAELRILRHFLKWSSTLIRRVALPKLSRKRAWTACSDEKSCITERIREEKSHPCASGQLK